MGPQAVEDNPVSPYIYIYIYMYCQSWTHIPE